MQLTQPQIARFQELYKARFGREISKKEALEQGLKLLGIMNIAYRPVSKADIQETAQKFRHSLAVSEPVIPS